MRCLLLGMVLLLVACGGGGGSVLLGPPTKPNPDPEPSPNTLTYSISGKIDIAAGIVVDDDINDIFAEHCSYSRLPGDLDCNNDIYAQRIDRLATVMGFASAVETGGDPEQERFHESADEFDFYYVEAKAHQKVLLNVVDFEHADLDLYLYQYVDGELSTEEIAWSENKDQYEELVIPSDGQYIIEVAAYAGISKYVLQMLPAVEGTQVTSFKRFISGELVVKHKPPMQAAGARSAAVDTEPQLVKLAASTPQARLTVAANSTRATPLNAELLEKRRTLKEIKRLRLSGDVEYAEPNYIRTTQTLPNDPAYSVQWHYGAINLPQAWDITTGHGAQDVTVAVLDTGVFLAHPDLSSKLVAGYDFVANKNGGDDPGDGSLPGTSSWHGTHVAGTIAAASNNSSGIAGVSWAAKLMPVRVLGKGGGTSFNVAQGIRYAASLSNSSGTLPAKKADIINLSLGSTGSSQAESDAIAAAINAGVLVVAAAGNNGKKELFYPAAYPDVIGVSATRFNGQKSSYSNYGSHVDIAAPGGQTSEDLNGDRNPDGVYSTYVNDSSGSRQPAYAWMQGTSMAAPHVSGVLALMKALNPNLQQSEILAMINSCAITAKKGQCSRDDNLGYGQIDAYLAVQKANELSTGDLPAILVPAVSALTIQPLSQTQPRSETVQVHNYGKDSATAITITNTQTWLTRNTAPPTNLAPNQSFQLSLSASAAGLNSGRYQDVVSIEYNNGEELKTLTIPVVLVVGEAGNGSTLTQHYVLLEDVDCIPETSDSNCIETVRPMSRVDRNGSQYADFTFTEVKPGNYRIYAGTDIDVDGFICQEGETCGVFPVAGQPLKLERSVAGANITVRLNGTKAIQTTGFARSGTYRQLRKIETVSKNAAR